MKGTDYILQTLYDYLKTTTIVEQLQNKLYKIKRPENTKDTCCVLSVLTGTTSTVQTFRCNVNIYVPSLCVGKTYYPDNTTLSKFETLCLQLLDNATYNDCLIRFADAPTYIECAESNEWLLNCSVDVLLK